jgi:serine/threonine-protein phosphatase 2B catalytic subunit
MLVAVLNTCTKEELEEGESAMSTGSASSGSPTAEESVQRRNVIKNKIMAVGRMARVFALLRYVPTPVFRISPSHSCGVAREESEWVSELKTVSGSSRLPYGTLLLGSEGIKNTIKSFEDACVFPCLYLSPCH